MPSFFPQYIGSEMAKQNLYYGYLISCLVLLIAEFGAGDDNADGVLLGGRKLIIGVPKKDGFTEFVDVGLISSNQLSSVITGYSIDVFTAAVAHLQSLGYNISYEFRPFVNQAGNILGTYDDLLLQIPAHKVDGVVGDVTITANRTNYVEFTHPYMESGVQMLVKLRHDRHLHMWTFLQPFSWDLWLCTFIFCLYIGGAIQFMERGNANADHARLQNSTHKEMLRGVSIVTLPLAQVVLPQRESVSKKSSRFVLVTWLILAFVLMQSYSASLSSFLTVGQLRANLVNDMKSIGYQCGSEYLRKLLEDQLSFKAERLRPLCSIEEYREALDRGRYNGGVDAIFDEVPYIKVFLNQYGSSNYTMVGPRYHTNGGFGFAFPRYSNLTFEFSRAILNMSDSMEMKKIERRYFGRSDEDEVVASSSSSSSSDTPSLTTRSFSGLFMITGILTSLALMVSERHVILKKVMSARKYLFISRSAKPSLESGSGDGSISRRNVGTAAQVYSIPKISRSLSA